MKDPSGDKLALDACRYALEEMSAPERESFECQLLEDQAAREAVAEAVAVLESVKNVFDSRRAQPEPVLPAARGEDSGRRRAVWSVMALAASVMLAIVIFGIERGGPGRAVQVAKIDPAKAVSAGSSQKVFSDDGSISDGLSDHSKQLASAWLSFVPSPADFMAETNGDSMVDDDVEATDDLEATSGTDDEQVALVDSIEMPAADASGDWLWEAVTASSDEQSSTALAPPEG